jgi:hypothetical protein
MPREAHPWAAFVKARSVDLIHLHDTRYLEEACAAGDRQGVPVVLSWPRGASAELPFHRLDRILVSSLVQRDRLLEAGCPEELLVVAPVPVATRHAPARRAPAKGQPLRWISAALAVETQSLALVLEAYLAYREVADGPSSLRVLTTAHLAAEAEGLIEELGLSNQAACDPISSHEELRRAFEEAHLGVFPLEPAEPDLDAGLTWPAWVAASTALPLVLGPEGTTDGFRDGQEAMLAELDPGAIARKMHFLAQRPYVWPNVGAQAARFASGGVDFHQACQVPYQVYKSVLREVQA